MAKKSLFDDADSDAASNVDEAIPKKDLKINEEYARRFEHNKKREERQRRACWPNLFELAANTT